MAAFTNYLDIISDALNSKTPKFGLRKNNDSHKELDMQLNTNNASEMTLYSLTTSESLRITIRILELSKFLWNSGYRYILTAKFNQDCLKKYFNLIRYTGSYNDHPSVQTFAQISTMMLKGNYEKETDEVLDYTAYMRSTSLFT